MIEEKRHRSSKNINLLLLEDVESLGRSGDLVAVKPGFARNMLIPKGKGVVADKFTLRMQKRLQEERAKQAEKDRKESEALASQVEGLLLEQTVKVDPEGNMYGSVSAADIVELLAGEGVAVERRMVQLPHPIKEVGEHAISLRLKEEVACSFKLKVTSEQEEPEEQHGEAEAT